MSGAAVTAYHGTSSAAGKRVEAAGCVRPSPNGWAYVFEEELGGRLAAVAPFARDGGRWPASVAVAEVLVNRAKLARDPENAEISGFHAWGHKGPISEIVAVRHYELQDLAAVENFFGVVFCKCTAGPHGHGHGPCSVCGRPGFFWRRPQRRRTLYASDFRARAVLR